MADICTEHRCRDCDPEMGRLTSTPVSTPDYLAIRFDDHHRIDWGQNRITVDGEDVTRSAVEASLGRDGFVYRQARHGENGALKIHVHGEHQNGWRIGNAEEAICMEIVRGHVRIEKRAEVAV